MAFPRVFHPVISIFGGKYTLQRWFHPNRPPSFFSQMFFYRTLDHKFYFLLLIFMQDWFAIVTSNETHMLLELIRIKYWYFFVNLAIREMLFIDFTEALFINSCCKLMGNLKSCTEAEEAKWFYLKFLVWFTIFWFPFSERVRWIIVTQKWILLHFKYWRLKQGKLGHFTTLISFFHLVVF